MMQHGQWYLGILYILIVAVIWTGSSYLVKYIYADSEDSSPFFVTYVCTSMFTLLLPLHSLCKLGQRKGNDRDDGARLIDVHEEESRENEWINWEVARTSAIVALLWFIANYSYNLSLLYTTVSSSTIISSLSSVFTMMISVGCRVEKASTIKFFGVLLCITGTVFTTLNDEEVGERAKQHRLLGDFYAFISAFLYGLYVTMIGKLVPDEKKDVPMTLVFGYIGIFSMVTLCPVVVCLFILTPLSSAVTSRSFGLITLKALLDNVLSDYLWAQSVILTTPTVATLGLSLTVPLSFVIDVLKGEPLRVFSALGAIFVLMGFFIVNTFRSVEGRGLERIKRQESGETHGEML